MTALLLALAGSSLAATPGEWTQQFVDDYEFVNSEGQVLTPSCSDGPGTPHTQFSYWVKEGQNPNKIVVWFGGGGGCVTDAMCVENPVYLGFDITVGGPLLVTTTMPDPQAQSAAPPGGIIGDSLDNPLEKYTKVYIPTCTADVHAGARDTTYMLGDLPWTIRHRGGVNAMAVLDRLQQDYPTANKIVLSGSSSGGFASVFHLPHYRDAFPNAQVSVLNDSMWLAFDQDRAGLDYWAQWGEDLVHPDYGDLSDDTFADLVEMAVQDNPDVEFGTWQKAFDTTMSFFYYMEPSSDFIPGWFPYTPEQESLFFYGWHDRMTAEVSAIGAAYPNFHYYISPGTTHQMLNNDEMYADAAYRPVSTYDWVATFLEGEGTSVDCLPGEIFCDWAPVPR